MKNATTKKPERKLEELALFLFFLVVFLAFIYPLCGPELPWHLKTGQYILTNGTIPMSSDPFSFATEKIPFMGRFILSQNRVAQSLLFVSIFDFLHDSVVGSSLVSASPDRVTDMP